MHDQKRVSRGRVTSYRICIALLLMIILAPKDPVAKKKSFEFVESCMTPRANESSDVKKTKALLPRAKQISLPRLCVGNFKKASHHRCGRDATTSQEQQRTKVMSPLVVTSYWPSTLALPSSCPWPIKPGKEGERFAPNSALYHRRKNSGRSNPGKSFLGVAETSNHLH
ncbi:hypothetical protein BDFG_03266 [Blastomyces dermatitidis ATCC 26199]|nr:hypothetical protein BDFG_03266 [Blastomyces dermatitidis ATCC 26199]